MSQTDLAMELSANPKQNRPRNMKLFLALNLKMVFCYQNCSDLL